MWGMRRRLGWRSKAPRDRSKDRMRHVIKYPLLEDCGKTKQSEWSSVTFGPGRASLVRRRGYFCSVRKSGPILLDASLSAIGPGSVKTPRGMHAPGILRPVVRRRAQEL